LRQKISKLLEQHLLHITFIDKAKRQRCFAEAKVFLVLQTKHGLDVSLR